MKILQVTHYYLSAMLMLTLVGYASAFTVTIKDESETVAIHEKPAVIFLVPASSTREVDIATLDMSGRY